MNLEDIKGVLAGKADLIDVLLKYGLVTPDQVKERIKKCAPWIKTVMDDSLLDGEVAHLIDVLMARAIFTPTEMKEVLGLNYKEEDHG